MAEGKSSGIDWGNVLGNVWDGFTPALPLLVPIFGLLVVLAAPLPGRGPGLLRRRDPWRGFKFAARRTVLDRAGQRCEAGFFYLLGRCSNPAEEADHVYPWSKGGATVVSNGQALCRRHNRGKSNLTPPWWYVLSLERRRRSYFPEGSDVRVMARMGAADKAARSDRDKRSPRR